MARDLGHHFGHYPVRRCLLGALRRCRGSWSRGPSRVREHLAVLYRDGPATQSRWGIIRVTEICAWRWQQCWEVQDCHLAHLIVHTCSELHDDISGIALFLSNWSSCGFITPLHGGPVSGRIFSNFNSHEGCVMPACRDEDRTPGTESSGRLAANSRLMRSSTAGSAGGCGGRIF